MRCVAVCKVTQFESAAKSLFMYTYMHMHLYRYRMDAGKVRHATRQTDATCYKLNSGIWHAGAIWKCILVCDFYNAEAGIARHSHALIGGNKIVSTCKRNI